MAGRGAIPPERLIVLGKQLIFGMRQYEAPQWSHQKLAHRRCIAKSGSCLCQAKDSHGPTSQVRCQRRELLSEGKSLPGDDASYFFRDRSAQVVVREPVLAAIQPVWEETFPEDSRRSCVRAEAQRAQHSRRRSKFGHDETRWVAY